MFYVTGDCHGDFTRFGHKKRCKLSFELTADDYVIVCGDLGLCWRYDNEFTYNCENMSRWPFKILWVQGNHESYTVIEDYPVEMWNGGKARHIIKDKVILLERGQVFNIDGKIFFTFGGAQSHDVQGGIFDKASPTFTQDRRRAIEMGLPYRVIGESWWPEELPNKQELDEGRRNLANVGYKVDYVISHCASNRIQKILTNEYGKRDYEKNVLTDYFEELEDALDYGHWYFGHYHENARIDEKHTLLYEDIVAIEKI